MSSRRSNLRASPSIEELDPASASDAELAAVHALEVAVEAEALPGEPVPPLAHSLAEYRHVRAFTVRRWWVAPAGGGAIAGLARCSYDEVPENRSHAFLDVVVDPSARRAGLGSTLFSAALGAAEEWGCSLLDLEARVGGPGEEFLRAVGAERRLVERRSQCRTAELDRGLLEGWVGRAHQRAAGYSLVSWDGPCPEELLSAYVDLKAVMNTAPLEDYERDDDHVTAEQQRQIEESLAARGYQWWTVCARHDDSGELAGLTEIVFPTLWPDVAFQEDTGVWPKHRQRGLGRWLKATTALRVLDDRPELSRIETWNTDSNEAMLGINVAMGFSPLENWGVWQVGTEQTRASL